MILGSANQYGEANIQQFLPEILFDQQLSLTSEEMRPGLERVRESGRIGLRSIGHRQVFEVDREMSQNVHMRACCRCRSQVVDFDGDR